MIPVYSSIHGAQSEIAILDTFFGGSPKVLGIPHRIPEPAPKEA